MKIAAKQNADRMQTEPTSIAPRDLLNAPLGVSPKTDRERIAARIRSVALEMFCFREPDDDLVLVQDLLTMLAMVVEYYDHKEHASRRVADIAAMTTALDGLTPQWHSQKCWWLSATDRAAREQRVGR